MKKLELEIVAISHSIAQANSYAVVLAEVEGKRRLPIIIGGFEAQSIAVAMEGITPTRPLTHDLIKNMCATFDMNLEEVIVNNLVDGVFYAQLICKKDNEIIEIDSRTSDAIALAVRFGCPIYTYEFILESAGLLLEDIDKEGEEEEEEYKAEGKKPRKKKSKQKVEKIEDVTKLSNQELNELLAEALEKEDYEKAIMARDEIDRRKKDT